MGSRARRIRRSHRLTDAELAAVQAGGLPRAPAINYPAPVLPGAGPFDPSGMQQLAWYSLFDVTPEHGFWSNPPGAEAFVETMLAGCDDEVFLE